ncbi:peptide ABC transporter permease [Pectobacterium araliae]|uniref:ABC transporter permease n=1 Tax=Pectobacterium araliae TaxID=3073862 RepID=A0AAN0KAN1_9GAMM|nr:ABC transporter permease [Pectobacterium sp. MAFF 302110]GKW21612.1 peptide ABC transporter permease [Pectobacterium carotovorum subsp. carotovorum]
MTGTRSILFRRLIESALRAFLTIGGVVIATFFILHIVPGDPVLMILGEHASNNAVQALRETLGLDRPMLEQFTAFLVGIFRHADAGYSLVYRVPSNELVLSRLSVTGALVLLSTLFTTIAVCILATVAALNEGKTTDHIIRTLSTIGAAMPVFWLAIILITLFSVNLRWFPVGGIGRHGFLNSLILPAITSAIVTAPLLVRSLRTQLLEVINAEFVTMLRINGLSTARIMFRHILPNAAIPTLILLGINISGMLGGSIILERVFALPGIGSLLFDAIAKRDFPLIQTIALFSAFGVVVVSLLTDIAVRMLDPRARLSQ